MNANPVNAAKMKTPRTIRMRSNGKDGEQFFHCQKLTDNLFLMELDAYKRVFGYPFVCQGKIGYLFRHFK